MTAQLLDTDAGSQARAVVRVALTLAGALGIAAVARLTAGDIAALQAALELVLVAAVVAKALAHHRNVDRAQVLRAVVRPTATLGAIVGWQIEAEALLVLIPVVEGAVAGVRVWWRS
jgi:hypothetical protein